MPATVTQADIINAAGALLGSSERVTSIDTANSLGKHAKAQWAILLNRLLADHPWNAFIRRRALNASATVADFGFERSFELPEDCKRVLLPRSDDTAEYFEGEIEGGMIHTDAEAPLHIRYISSQRAEDVSRWPPHLVEAATYALAALLAEALTGSQSIANRFDNKAEDKLSRAKRIDGLETAPRDRQRISRRSNWLRGYQGVPFNPWDR